MEEIDVFAYSKLKIMNEKPSKIISWITILATLFFTLLIISIFFKYHLYSNYIGYVQIDNKYNIKVIIDDELPTLNKDYKLYINNHKYKYKIVEINKQVGYYEMYIKCDLDKSILINNNIITVRFKKEQTTLIRELIKKFKKGMK